MKLFLVLAVGIGCAVIAPSFVVADNADTKKIMEKLIEQVKEKDFDKVTNDLSLYGCNIFSDEIRGKTYLPLAMDLTQDSVTHVQSMFLFNARGEGFEFEPSAGFGERKAGRDIKVELWTSELISGGEYTPYVYWSNGSTGGIVRLPVQSLTSPKTDHVLSAMHADDKNTNGSSRISYIRSCGNLHAKDAIPGILDILNNTADSQTRQACFVAIAKSRITTEHLSELQNKQRGYNANALLKEVGVLEKVFREDATINDLLEVSNIDNDEAKIWVILRLAYLGKEEFISKIPIKLPWSRLMKLRPAVTALADMRKNAMQGGDDQL